MTDLVPVRTAPTAPGLPSVTAAGVLLVAYSYLVALWPDRHAHTPAVVEAVRAWVGKPTGLGEDFGFLGTALLLLAAGFALTGTGLSTRVLRAGIPPLVAAVVVGGVLWLLDADPLTDAAMTAPVLALVLFAALTPALRPLELRAPALAVFVLLELACVAALLCGWWAAEGGPEAARVVGTAATLLPLPATGRLTWLARAGRLPVPHAAGLGLVGVGLLVPADLLFPDNAPYWHPLGAAVAVLLFLIALPHGGPLGPAAPVRWAARRAWPLALAVPVVGYPVLTLCAPLPFALALPVALASNGLAAEALHREARRRT
ncbi:hypothetical protein AB0I60_11065 [Actinosynnema sp. NPDC050436]|uniref:hypothetical protein n=1 Tax=Actinosynnema sp. NPDC050436 TaxID=3155659 RepID=UPI0033E72094